jgi:hypothetical protein
MSKVRHRAPAARRAELVSITKQAAPLSYATAPMNRRQRRTLCRMNRGSTKTKRPGGK